MAVPVGSSTIRDGWRAAGHAFSRTYRTSLPSSFAHVSPIRRSLLSQSPCVGSGYDTNASCRSVFKGTRIQRLAPQAEPHSSFHRGPNMMFLTRFIELATAKTADRLSLCVRTCPYVTASHPCSGILTGFPFVANPAEAQLRIG